MNRRDELQTNLRTVEDRIVAACADAGRDRSEVHLIVITKTYPASDVALLVELGVTDVGENRHPEAQLKLEELRAMAAGRTETLPRCHFVGGLQTNKAAAIARYADVVHSVDRLKLVRALDKGAVAADRGFDCLVQVALSDDAGRSGAAPDEVESIAAAIAASERLRLGGVMAVAPLGADPAAAFERLAGIAAEVRSRHPEAVRISAGMSGDLEAAVRAGATHLRIGRSVLGARPSLR